MSLTLADFEDADRAILERLHGELSAMLRVLRPEGEAVDAEALRQRCEAPGWRSLMQSMKVFGLATYEVSPRPEVKQIMHDLRGGALAVLMLRLQTTGDSFDAIEAERLRRLTREHLRLMQACVRDIGGQGPQPTRGSAPTLPLVATPKPPKG